MPKRIAVLGSTGSIGTQTLDVLSRYPGDFEVEVLTAGNNVRLLEQQARKFMPDAVVIGNEGHYHILRDSLRDVPVKVYAGEEAIEQIVAGSNIDMVVAAMVGYSGLRPTISAVNAGKRIALANKETLVVAGEIIRKLMKESGSRIIPVDSEHSAIFQCLAGEAGNPVEKITLTASGGPFLNLTASELQKVKPHEALKHPNWEMGNKVTVDSASLMNKGLEVIEAAVVARLPNFQFRLFLEDADEDRHARLHALLAAQIQRFLGQRLLGGNEFRRGDVCSRSEGL